MSTVTERTDKRQQYYARLAGFLFIWLIITGLAGMLLISNVTRGSTFSETAQNVIASVHLYRLGLLCELVETLSALLLAFSLYVVFLPVNALLGRMAFYWRLSEALIGCIGVVFGYMKLQLYTSAPSLTAVGSPEALLNLLRSAGTASYNSGVLCFSVGSVLFYYLFLRSGYIPRILSLIGIFASVVVFVMVLGLLMFPELSGKLQYGWAPMAIAEIGTGFWLLFAGIKPRAIVRPAMQTTYSE